MKIHADPTCDLRARLTFAMPPMPNYLRTLDGSVTVDVADIDDDDFDDFVAAWGAALWAHAQRRRDAREKA